MAAAQRSLAFAVGNADMGAVSQVPCKRGRRSGRRSDRASREPAGRGKRPAAYHL